MKNRLFAQSRRTRAFGGLFLSAFLSSAVVLAADPDTEQRLKLLEQRNIELQNKLLQQQGLIDDLSKRLSDLSGKTSELPPAADATEASKKNFKLGQVRLSAEGGVGVFHTSGLGRYRNSEFRVDEARLFLEAPLWENHAFAFAELELMTRERQLTPADEAFHLGEFYVDFEGVSRLWDQPGMLGIRVGRIDVPFGEEYAARDAIDNPLISHSLSDIWGIDEGIEFYGKFGQVDYVFAVQNGSHPQLADYDRDKSIAGRVGWRPAKWLRVSGSAMRTGAISAATDKMSEVWFGNGFVGWSPLAGAGAKSFEANLYEGDAQISWSSGHLKAAVGWVDYTDNAPGGVNNKRDALYYYAEALQRIPVAPKFYGAARFSQIIADNGFPIVANGDFGHYFGFPPATSVLTKNIWRLSAGTGYQFSDHLTLKLEYTYDRRKITVGAIGEDTHLLAAEIAFAF